jgi:hypothetical protein
MQNTTTLPNGSEIINWVGYTSQEAHGVTVLVALSCLSLVAVVGLLITLCLSTANSRKPLNQHIIFHNQIAAYFVSLLLCNLLQAVASIMSAHWVNAMGVRAGTFCVAQGVLKQAADIGSALWILIIAIHSFYLLFLEWKLGRYIIWTNLIIGWAIIIALVVAGATLDQGERGPFYGISEYSCWISDEYMTERISLDYITMFVSSTVNFILYLLVFLRLKGNEAVLKWHRGMVGTKATKTDREREYDDSKLLSIGRHMLLYPIAFTIMFIPIAVVRFSAWTGRSIPLEFTIFSSSLSLLSGIINVILFITARPVPPLQSRKRMTSFDPTVITAPPTAIPRSAAAYEFGRHPYYAPPDPHRPGYTSDDDPYYPKFDYAVHEPYFPRVRHPSEQAASDNELPTPVFKRSASYESLVEEADGDEEKTLADGPYAAEDRPVPAVPALLVARPPAVPRPVPPVPAEIEVPSRSSVESRYSVDSMCSPRLQEVPLSGGGQSVTGGHRGSKGKGKGC